MGEWEDREDADGSVAVEEETPEKEPRGSWRARLQGTLKEQTAKARSSVGHAGARAAQCPERMRDGAAQCSARMRDAQCPARIRDAQCPGRLRDAQCPARVKGVIPDRTSLKGAAVKASGAGIKAQTLFRRACIAAALAARKSCAGTNTTVALTATAACVGAAVPAARLALGCFTAGWLGRHAIAATESIRKAREMVALSKALSLPEEAPEAVVEAWAGRSFPISRSDTALVLIDMQTDFLSASGRLGGNYSKEQLEPLQRTLRNVEQLLSAARAAGLTIAHSRSHRYGAAVRRDLVSPLDEGYELCPEVRAKPGEIVVDKWTFGAFASTDLEAKLRARGVRRILLAGILTNVCIFATAVQAVDRFFRVCLVEDACGAFNHDWHRRAVSLIHEPQSKKGHHDSQGLYFGEVAFASDVEVALGKLP